VYAESQSYSIGLCNYIGREIIPAQRLLHKVVQHRPIGADVAFATFGTPAYPHGRAVVHFVAIGAFAFAVRGAESGPELHFGHAD
jgi:hypothetical protein